MARSKNKITSVSDKKYVDMLTTVVIIVIFVAKTTKTLVTLVSGLNSTVFEILV